MRSLPAVIVVTERIADAEMHCILGHLRGCVREVFVRNDGPAFRRSLPPHPGEAVNRLYQPIPAIRGGAYFARRSAAAIGVHGSARAVRGPAPRPGDEALIGRRTVQLGAASGLVRASNVVLELIDGLTLIGDDPLHQVADGEDTHHLVALEHR